MEIATFIVVLLILFSMAPINEKLGNIVKLLEIITEKELRK